MNDWQSLISGVAFPIAVAAYLLVFMNKTLTELKALVSANTELLKQLIAKLK